jgi:hypothetical protein
MTRTLELTKEMTRTLELTKDGSADGAGAPGDGLDDAMQQLQSAAAPLLQLLNAEVRDSI